MTFPRDRVAAAAVEDDFVVAFSILAAALGLKDDYNIDAEEVRPFWREFSIEERTAWISGFITGNRIDTNEFVFSLLGNLVDEDEEDELVDSLMEDLERE